MRKCVKCHYQNSDDSMFCIGCGAQLMNDSQGPAQSQQPQQPQQFQPQQPQQFQPQQPQQFQPQQPQQFQSQQYPQQQPGNPKSITKKWWFWTLIAVAVIVLLVSGFFAVRFISSKVDTGTGTLGSSSGSSEGSSGSSGSNQSSSNNDKVFKVGEKITITQDGKPLYTITVNSVKLTTDRDKYDTTKPKNVVIINYTYENLASDEDIYIYDSYFKVIDADGNLCDDYSISSRNYPKETPMGAKCTADAGFGLMSDKTNFKLMFYSEPYGGGKADATYELTAE